MEKLCMKRNMCPGILITFCGLDGCGKTTLINHLVEYFHQQGIEPLLTKQPTFGYPVLHRGLTEVERVK